MTTSTEFVSKEELNELADNMNKKYQYFLDDRHFEIQGHFDSLASFVTVCLQNDDQTYVYPVEGRIHFIEQDTTARLGALLLVDYIDMYFEEFLGDHGEDLMLPIDWSDFEWEATKFQLRGQIVNKNLELQADALLNTLSEGTTAPT